MKESTAEKRLTPKLECYGPNAFPDFFTQIASVIEDSLLQTGAKAGTDYTVLDLYNLAQPFVLSRFNKGELTDWK